VAREIELFGFAFDEPRSRYAPREMRERVTATKYVWKDDQILR